MVAPPNISVLAKAGASWCGERASLLNPRMKPDDTVMLSPTKPNTSRRRPFSLPRRAMICTCFRVAESSGGAACASRAWSSGSPRSPRPQRRVRCSLPVLRFWQRSSASLSRASTPAVACSEGASHALATGNADVTADAETNAADAGAASRWGSFRGEAARAAGSSQPLRARSVPAAALISHPRDESRTARPGRVPG